MKRVSLQGARVATLRAAALLLVYTASLLMTAGAASAQTVQQRLDAVTAHLKQLQDLAARLPASQRAKLSSGTQHMLRMAGRWDELQLMLGGNSATTNAPLNGHAFHPSGSLGRGDVSDPSTDLSFSRLAGFTQSETSTAWCGGNVVVAYNDSGSFLETLFLPIGLSFNGYSRSTDGGRSFTDQGFLNPGPNIFNFLQGDPVAVCTDENTFYQSSILSGATTSGVSVSKSTDGGRTFGDPVQAVSKDGSFHIIDKPWMAADPSNPKRLYVTYTDFDFSGPICPLRIGIELVSSTDRGATWSAPTVVDDACFPDGNQGSNVAVDGAGNVYVAWEHFPSTLSTNEIDIAKSTNGGASFSPKVVVAIVTPVGSPIAGLLQGGFRNNEYPSLAIDRSGGARNGTLYITWNDGRDGVVPDFVGGTYNFGDVLVTRSSNGGGTWSTPVKVNDKTDADDSPADHYLPGVAVSSDGSVGICWYDRRRDPENFLIERECGSSKNGGQTWRNHRVTKESFAPAIAQDLLVNPMYMGDYDGVAADLLGKFDGFRGAYGDNTRGNPDVKISPRFGGKNNSDDEDQ